MALRLRRRGGDTKGGGALGIPDVVRTLYAFNA